MLIYLPAAKLLYINKELARLLTRSARRLNLCPHHRTAVFLALKYSCEYIRLPYCKTNLSIPVRRTYIFVDEYTRPPYWDINVCFAVRKTIILVDEYIRPPFCDVNICFAVRKTNIFVDEYIRLPSSALTFCQR